MQHILRMPLADAILAAKALLNHVSTDDVTPVITHAAIVEHDGQKYLVGTDGYSFGRFLLGDQDHFEGEVGQMIPRDALTWISKIVPKGLRRPFESLTREDGYSLQLTWTTATDTPKGHEVDAAIVLNGKVERSQTYDVAIGNFPPVARLWRDDTVEQGPLTKVTLNHAALTKVAADVALFSGKGHNGSASLQFHSDPETRKPAPVQYTLGAGDRWTAAIQPNLDLR